MLLKVVNSEQGIEEVRTRIRDAEYVAYDCETNGVHSGATVIGFSVCADELVSYYVVTHEWNVKSQSLIQVLSTEKILPIIEDLKGKKLICHNGVFDCARAEENYKVRLIDSLHTDTMILAHLLNENRRVGLKELAKEMFGEDVTKEQAEMKASVLANGGRLTVDHYEMYKCDSQIMGKYGAKDAWLTYKLFLELVPELYKQKLDKFFYEDESMPLLRGPTYDLNTTGLKVDQKELTQLKKTLEAEIAEAKDFIYSEIKERVKDKYPGTNKKNTFNIGSKPQLAWLLFDVYGLEFGTLTDAGKQLCKDLYLKIPYSPAAKRQFIATCEREKGRTTELAAFFNGKKVREKKVRDVWNYLCVDKKTLSKFAPKIKWIEKLLEYQKKLKLLNTYVEGIEERLQYGIIRPSFLQHGTTSGRYSSRSPNFQNLPRDDKRIKHVIVARTGKSFVGADYSQLEPRVFAYYSNDARLLRAFNGKTDFYSTIGMEVYDKYDCNPTKEGPEAFGTKYKRLRDLSKVIALASTYGATAHQLAPTTGKSIDDTQQDIERYFEKFPDVKRMMLDSHELAKKNGQVTNLFGRPRRMPEAKKITKIYGNLPHEELPYQARNTLNLAVNHRIQSTAASIVNRAAIQFYKDAAIAGIKCKLVVQVHDSLVIECNTEDAENVSILLQNAMENTTDLKSVKLEAIPRISQNLAGV